MLNDDQKYRSTAPDDTLQILRSKSKDYIALTTTSSGVFEVMLFDSAVSKCNWSPGLIRNFKLPAILE